MVDVTELAQIGILKPADRRPGWRRRPRSGYEGGGEQPRLLRSRRDHPEVTDHAEILGIPPKELTPRVQAAIRELLDELEHEHQDLERAQEHVEYLENQLDRHAVFPVLNRHALMRELGRMIDHAVHSRTASAFLLVHLRNLESVRNRFGLRAGEALMGYAAQTLTARLRQTDICGVLGGSDFGVILALADETGALETAGGLKHALESHPVAWHGRRVPLEIAYGLRMLTPEETAEQTVAAADDDLRGEQTETPLA